MTLWSLYVLHLRGTEDAVDFIHVVNTHCTHVPETHTQSLFTLWGQIDRINIIDVGLIIDLNHGDH